MRKGSNPGISGKTSKMGDKCVVLSKEFYLFHTLWKINKLKRKHGADKKEEKKKRDEKRIEVLAEEWNKW